MGTTMGCPVRLPLATLPTPWVHVVLEPKVATILSLYAFPSHSLSLPLTPYPFLSLPIPINPVLTPHLLSPLLSLLSLSSLSSLLPPSLPPSLLPPSLPPSLPPPSLPPSLPPSPSLSPSLPPFVNFPSQWQTTQYTAAGSQGFFNPSDDSVGWCGSGCGACYNITPTGDCPTGMKKKGE